MPMLPSILQITPLTQVIILTLQTMILNILDRFPLTNITKITRKVVILLPIALQNRCLWVYFEQCDVWKEVCDLLRLIWSWLPIFYLWSVKLCWSAGALMIGRLVVVLWELQVHHYSITKVYTWLVDEVLLLLLGLLLNLNGLLRCRVYRRTHQLHHYITIRLVADIWLLTVFEWVW